MQNLFQRRRFAVFRYAAVFIFLSFSNIDHLYAQTVAEIDSLNKLILTGNDSIKIAAMTDMAKLLCETDLIRAEYYARNAFQLSKQINNPSCIAKSLLRLGTVYEYKEKYDSASVLYYQSLKIAEKIKDTLTIANTLQNIGVMHYYQGNIKEAEKFYMKAASLLQKIGNKEYLAKVYNNLGAIKRKQKKYNEAIFYYKESLNLKKEINDRKGVQNSYFNLAIVYEYKDMLDSSIYLIRQSIAFDKSNNDNYNLAHDYTTLGEIYVKKNELQTANALYDTALTFVNLQPNNYLYSVLYTGKSIIDTLNQNYKSAFYHASLAKYYNDKVYDEEIANKAATIAAIYENEKKETTIDLQKKQINNKNKILWLSFISLGLISLLALVIFYTLQRKKKDNKLLQQQKQEIEAKTEEVKTQAEEIAKIQSQMNPHFVYNALGSIQNIISENKTELANQQISEFAKLMRTTLNNADKKVITLSEEIEFLKRYILFEQKNSATLFSFNIHTDKNIDVENIAIPVMLIQPLLENCIKHGIGGKADGKIQLSFLKKEDILQITVDDNGKGRKEKTNLLHTSKAVSILEKRVLSFNAEHSIMIRQPVRFTDKKDDNDTAIGTTVTIELHLLELY